MYLPALPFRLCHPGFWSFQPEKKEQDDEEQSSLNFKSKFWRRIHTGCFVRERVSLSLDDRWTRTIADTQQNLRLRNSQVPSRLC